MNYPELVSHVKTLKVNPHSRVLHATHRACMDGCTCQILVKNCFNNVKYEEYTPQSLKQFLEYSTFEEYDLVLVTDISLYKGFSYSNPKVIFIDHHDSSLEYANLDYVFVSEKFCSSVLLKKFFEDTFSVDLRHLSELVKLINDHDLWVLKNSKSLHMSYLYYFYWNQKFIKRFGQGNVTFVDDEIAHIKTTEHNFREYFKAMEIYDLQKINGCLAFGDKFINETCHKLLREENYKIVFYRNIKNSTVSIRSSIEGFNLGSYLSEVGYGGGHREAGGMKETDQLKLQEKLKKIEQYIYENFKDTRKI